MFILSALPESGRGGRPEVTSLPLFIGGLDRRVRQGMTLVVVEISERAVKVPLEAEHSATGGVTCSA